MFGRLIKRMAAGLRLTRDQPRKPVDFLSLGVDSIDPNAVRSSAVWACVHRIASRVGQAEFRVARYRRENATWAPMPNHTVTGMLRSPSPRLPAYVFWRTVAEHVLTTGNAYIIAGQRDSANYPLYMMIASPVLTALQDSERGPIYTLQLPTIGSGRNIPIIRPAPEVAHVRGPHLDIHTGLSLSPIRYAAEAALCLGNEAIEAAVASMQNATRFSGVFETQVAGVDNPETEAYFERMRQTIQEKGKGTVPVLPHGIKYITQPGMQRDMQMAGDLNWTVQDIARVYGVPLALIQHTAGQRPDIEQLEEGLLRDAVWPVLHSIAAGLTFSCLSTDERMSGLAVRPGIMAGGPTPSGQTDMAMKMGQTGAVSINEVRHVLGLPPRPEGDDLPQTAGAGEREESEGESEDDTEDTEDDSDSDTEDDDDDDDNGNAGR